VFGGIVTVMRELRVWVTSLWVLAAAGLLGAEFEFVVIGDTRPGFESENFRIFEGLIGKINEAKPALVINLGDLIYGYGVRSKEKQWDRYQEVIKKVGAPYYQIPGNHDVYSKEARRIYGRRFGKFYESFDYGDCHFVLLDNAEEGRWGYVGPAQLEWLKRDLATNQAGSVFVFLHFPVWEPERVAPKYYESWLRTLHPLFRQSRVRGVFAGHFHSYGPSREFDGIRYFITGGGGAELRANYRHSGGEHHFVRVKAGGGSFDLRVITQRGELSDVEADVLGGLEFADKHATRVGLRRAGHEVGRGVDFSITLDNPYPVGLNGSAAWSVDSSVFAVEPASVAVRVGPRGTQRFGFRLKALKESASLQSLPRLEFQVASGAWRHRFHREVIFLEEWMTPWRAVAPAVGSGREVWGPVRALALSDAVKPPPEVRALHDGKNLWLAVSVPSRKADEEDEESAFPDALQIGVAGRSGPTEFGRDVLRLGLSGAGASFQMRDRTPRGKPASLDSGVKGAGVVDGDRTTYELSIPLSLLGAAKPKAGDRLVLNLSFRLPEKEAEPGQAGEPAVNSFSYQVRYGGEGLVPLHFVELVLGGGK
jgi:hypothetical protein